MTTKDARYVLHLAVIPAYRRAAIQELKKQLGDDLLLIAGDAHLVSSVRTDHTDKDIALVRNIPLFGRRLLLQWGGLGVASRAEVLIVDLNPRCLSAWMLLFWRRLLSRRTLVWGHLYPRAGAQSRTTGLRHLMRRMADGFIAYDYAAAAMLRTKDPQHPVWVAANALLPRQEIFPVPLNDRADELLYVGRIEVDKNLDRLLEIFSMPALRNSQLRLRIVGDGAHKEILRQRSAGLGIEEKVTWVAGSYDQSELRTHYGSALAAVSPGYAGLSITQSLGFGRPIWIADAEEHAPEVELVSTGGVHLFPAQSTQAAAEQLATVGPPSEEEQTRLSAHVAQFYSAEAMAGAIIRALRGINDGSVYLEAD